MFGRKGFNDFGDFDDIFRQFDAIFGGALSKATKEDGNDEMGEWTKETYTSEDGSIQITNFIRTNGSPMKPKGSSIKSLKMKLERAIENEDFEEAVKLRDQIKNFEMNNEKIENLDKELKQAIKEQNFEKAIELRDEIKKLRS